MKKKTFKKLSFEKTAVSVLNASHQKMILGGGQNESHGCTDKDTITKAQNRGITTVPVTIG